MKIEYSYAKTGNVYTVYQRVIFDHGAEHTFALPPVASELAAKARISYISGGRCLLGPGETSKMME